MQATIERKVIIKNMMQEFWTGGFHGVGLDDLPALEAYEFLKTISKDLPKNIKFKEDQFNRMVELNNLMKGCFSVSVRKEPRRGYQLMTFTFEKA